jgi:hypothetical protein
MSFLHYPLGKELLWPTEAVAHWKAFKGLQRALDPLVNFYLARDADNHNPGHTVRGGSVPCL